MCVRGVSVYLSSGAVEAYLGGQAEGKIREMARFACHDIFIFITMTSSKRAPTCSFEVSSLGQGT